jgi:hypothetical protein
MIEINIFENPILFLPAPPNSTKPSFIGEAPVSLLPGFPAPLPLYRVKPDPVLLNPIHNQ